MRPPPIEEVFDLEEKPNRSWVEWFRQDLFNVVSLDNGSGTTANRPVDGIKVGSRYFDDTLGIPIFYDGAGWIDAQGNSV